MLLPDSAEERRRKNSNLHASLFLCCLYPKEEITAPAAFDIKDFDGNILLAVVKLGVVKGNKTKDLNKSEKIFL